MKFNFIRRKLLTIFFLLFLQFYSSQCHYLLHMYDSYGDGWNGAYLEVKMNGVHVGDYDCDASYTLDSVYSFNGALMDFIFHSGNWDSEITFTILDPLGDTIIDGPAPDDLDNLSHVSNSVCPASSCVNPSALNANNITVSSADLSWAPGLMDSIWNLEWGLSGFTQGTGNVINNLSNPNFFLSALNANTSYDFYVQAVCDSGNLSIWSGPYNFNTVQGNGTCGIFTVELYDSWGDGWNGGFLEILVNGNNVQTITVQQGSGPDQFYISVDSSDIVDLIYSPGGWPEENSYIVYDHNNGLVVSQMGSGSSGPPSTIGLIACPNCQPPDSLFVSNITADSALLSWNSSSAIIGGSWNIEWGTTGFLLGNGSLISNVSVPSQLLTGLSSFTTYDFYVQENCAQNGSSNWSVPYSFSTPPVDGTCGMYTVVLYDSFGDGWNGGFLDININNNIIQTITLTDGAGPEYFDFPVDSGDIVSLIYSSGDWSNENSYKLYDENSNIIANQSGSLSSGPLSTIGLIACEDSASQANCGLLRVELYDEYCDGWSIYGASIDVIIDGVNTQNIALSSGCGPATFLFPVDSGSIVDLEYSTTYQNEHSYMVYDQFGVLIYDKTSIANNYNGPTSTYGIQLCDLTTSIIKSGNDILIYPNPSNDKVYIESNIVFTEIVVTDIIGQVIYHMKNPNCTELSISHIPKGNYILELINKQKTYKKRIIKY